MGLVDMVIEECKSVVSFWVITVVAGQGVETEVLLAGAGVGMGLINTLAQLRPMGLVPTPLLVLMLLASLLSPHLPISTATANCAGQQPQQKQNDVAAVMAAYCRWALPQLFIMNITTLTQTTRTRTPAHASLAFHVVLVLALALWLGLGVQGVAMATWCSDHVAHTVLSAVVLGDQYQIRLPAAEEEEEEEEVVVDVEPWRYNSLLVIAWLLLPPSSPVSSFCAAVAMMRMASFVQALSAALARCYSHFGAFPVCVLGWAQGLLMLAMEVALQKWFYHVAADSYPSMLAMTQESGPAWRVWAVATAIRSSACAYLCHRRGGHGGIAQVKVLYMWVVGVPVSLLSGFLLHRNVVVGLCHGVAAVQLTQAVAFTFLMFRQRPAAEVPYHDHADSVVDSDSEEAGSDVASVFISISSSLVDDASPVD